MSCSNAWVGGWVGGWVEDLLETVGGSLGPDSSRMTVYSS